MVRVMKIEKRRFCMSTSLLDSIQKVNVLNNPVTTWRKNLCQPYLEEGSTFREDN